ncbi:putative hydrogen peroxide-inducible genes activator OS=Tsukamurella paurometabola (strain ATCC 8368/ DSM / CCUG 35730 / CIP 100753 / JCM 10117 / KCTC 9821 / NBRC 16120 / NCIMB 702349 / NCTC 13040) OX=521096 GN=Tpau_1816 PE=3 SV=1 [Tsukamurella paurometabola]|uniref:Probable hydrogen peroxide-inducible genes activator n=1 Tax=Tsukamurella paurometabola (strain ATCC 8368 / DSM 20162 / CCUG 35730 / CIP 100753 / JCM 10117 / KCTC 9821 / NBRC 16120 / NCIMB 702349 / NCTC 13040) TaxID=521096 RepID=D5UMT7_TSUPD|nr:hydrogen peroxide-inducible genes activator [Tsukamurella paurometabola]ADG78434.1 transcriptional regulator, LysR family [Tsukamurella paurometabola DSM 20162]SUP31617.1 Morphology and auto-aggregation control protein [Tsukamurella paurometabola]
MSDQPYQPTLAQLRAFVAVARSRHFGTAAAKLGVSQPSLSQALSSLESGLGVQLVERSTRKVLITEAGMSLLEQTSGIVSSAAELVSSAAGLTGELRGTLRLGLIPTVAPYRLPALLPKLRSEVDDLTVTVVEDQTARLLESLRAGRIDAAILALPALNSGLTEIPLYDEEFVLVVPPEHPLAGRTDLGPDDLTGLPLLLLDEGHCLRDQALDLCRQAEAGVGVIGDTRAASLATIVQCVSGGLGVTLLPEPAVGVELRGTDLATARFASPKPGRRIGLVYRASTAKTEGFATLAEIARAAAAG